MIFQILNKSELTVPAALFAIAALISPAPAASADEEFKSGTSLEERLSLALATQYPGTRINVNSKIHWTRGDEAATTEGRLSLLGETSRGEAMFAILDADGQRVAEGWAAFSAWQPARVAIKRALPGQRIQEDQFVVRDINVATSPARDLRGLILSPLTELSSLETRQSVLEGQMLLSSAVHKIPDVRRGDAVTVHLISNGLSLSTQGRAEEPGYRGRQIKVSASKTKRELIGELTQSGVVEVKL